MLAYMSHIWRSGCQRQGPVWPTPAPLTEKGARPAARLPARPHVRIGVILIQKSTPYHSNLEGDGAPDGAWEALVAIAIHKGFRVPQQRPHVSTHACNGERSLLFYFLPQKTSFG